MPMPCCFVDEHRIDDHINRKSSNSINCGQGGRMLMEKTTLTQAQNEPSVVIVVVAVDMFGLLLDFWCSIRSS